MKRRIVIPSRPANRIEGERPPREKRTLGLRYELVTGETVSGLR